MFGIPAALLKMDSKQENSSVVQSNIDKVELNVNMEAAGVKVETDEELPTAGDFLSAVECKQEMWDVNSQICNFYSGEFKQHENDHAVKKECEEEIKIVKKKRGTKKGAIINGCVDKKTLPKTLTLGSCKCPFCKKQFDISDLASEKVYRRHLYVHRVKKFECQCEKTWQSEKDLKLHIYTSHRGNFHCETCRETFQTEEMYEKHVASDPHKIEPLVCDDCGFTSTSNSTFYSHIKYQHDKNIRKCELCDKEFEGTFRLKLHMRTFHAEKKPCPLCGEMIKKTWVHMKNMHTKDSDKRYQCDQCGKGFLDMDKLRGHHISVHLKARPYVCRFGCGAASSDKGNRKKHEVTKHGTSFEEFEGGYVA